MQGAVDGAGLKGHVKIYFKKQTRERKKQKQNNVMKTAPGVVAEVKKQIVSSFNTPVSGILLAKEHRCLGSLSASCSEYSPQDYCCLSITIDSRYQSAY